MASRKKNRRAYNIISDDSDDSDSVKEVPENSSQRNGLDSNAASSTQNSNVSRASQLRSESDKRRERGGVQI